ncbi:MAG: hypothetical protein QOH75_2885 [Actinomycetota bacterium]|jgi:hypothetical protein|nr:hypothetical protein [Actinomycetota bacterium]
MTVFGRPAVRSDIGVTLTETLVAMVVFFVVMSGVIAGMIQSQKLSRDGRAREVAANLASQEVDASQDVKDFANLTSGTTTQVVNNDTFTILRTVTPGRVGGSGSPCDGTVSPFVISYKQVNIRVTWPNMGKTAPVRADTAVTAGVGNFDPDKGNVAVKVLNAGAGPVEGAKVILTTGATNRSELTDPQGCVFLDQIPAGSWTVSVTASGYVDPVGKPTPSRPIDVQGGRTTSAQFDYDQAAQLGLQLPATTHPAPLAVPITVGNPSLPLRVQTFAGSGLLRDVNGLFPFASGYTAWAGSCTDADPEGAGYDQAGSPTLIYHPGAIRDAAVPVVAGARTTGNVNMAQVTVTALGAVGQIESKTVRAVHAPDPASCTSGETYDAGVTDATGRAAFALPWGTWQLELVGSTQPAAGWPTVTLHPTSPQTDVSVDAL